MQPGRTRAANACQRCRRKKIRCSGTPPCRTCRDRGLSCNWGSEDKQVLVSERELFELRNKVKQLESQRATDSNETIPPQDRDESSRAWDDFAELYDDTDLRRNTHDDSTDISNPLAPAQPAYLQESSGQLLYLGHSSTFAFTQQVLHILQQEAPSNPSPEIIVNSNTDGTPFKADSLRLIPLMKPDISGLPSKSTALHYLQCIRFRTQPLFYLFDDDHFIPRLQNFYKSPLSYAQSELIWYIHYLVLMAFGKALDLHEQTSSSSASSVPEYLSRALRLSPDMNYFADDMVEAAEFFSCVALYLQSTDNRRAAISYIALAIRMAHLYGLHLGLQESVVGSAGVERGRRVWWTVYALNQKLTSSQGIPSFLNNEDITCPFPSMTGLDGDDNASDIHFKICQLLSNSISKVYFPSEKDRISFVSTTQTVLRAAAGIADQVKQYSENCFGEISRVAAHLELAYHHCIILACRPALFCLVKLRSENCRGERPNTPSTALTGLVQVCIDSAVQTVDTLEQLKTHNLLDTFLPFDLEYSFSTALVLTITIHVLPQIILPTGSVQTVKEVINAIVARGSVQARTRFMEIEQLEELLHRQTQQLLQARRPNDNYETFATTSGDAAEQEQLIDHGDLFFDGWDFNSGLHSQQMMSLADALGPEDLRLLG